MSQFANLPKVELHLHLEGGAPPEFIRELAEEKGMSLYGVFDDEGNYKWHDFTSFLDTYHHACSVLTGPEEFRRLTEAVLARSASHGVIYTELFISPDICGGGDQAKWQDYLDAICEGCANAGQTHGIEARLTGTAIRNLGPEAAVNAARLIAVSANHWLTGFGMGGDERSGDIADFAPAFAIAEDGGMGLTCHAGELVGAASVEQTINALNVQRIGHGVRSIENPDLVKRLADENIILEVNPGSNVSLSVVPCWKDHPIQALREAGVMVTVSTDDPPFFHTDMTREYDMLAQTFGWTEEDFVEVNEVAIQAAFCDDETKARLTERL